MGEVDIDNKVMARRAKQKEYYATKGKEVRRKYYQDNKEGKQSQSREYQRKRRELFKEYERLVNEQRVKAQKEEPKTL